MKKRSLFCRSLILSLLLYPSSDAWSAPFTGQIPLRGNSMSLLEVVREIEETTDYSFFYKSSDLEGSAKKNYNLNGDIEEVLSEVFEGSGIVYKVNGKEIILSKDLLGYGHARQRRHRDGCGLCGKAERRGRQDLRQPNRQRRVRFHDSAQRKRK